MAAKKKKRSAVGKKKAGKKPKRAAAASIKPRLFRYFCQSNVCAVAPRSKHISPGDIVALFASGTDVTIDFGAGGTPFTSGTNPIQLADGVPQAFVVDSRTGTFTYSIVCKACGDQVAIPPEMIVP
jgi:hypothetical protein